MWTVFALALALAQTPRGNQPSSSRADQLAHIEALVHEASPAAIVGLSDLLGHPLHDVRFAALRGLGRLGAPAAVEAAIQWLGSADLPPRVAALEALAEPNCPFPAQAATATLAQLADARSELRLPALALLRDRHVHVPSPMLAILAEDENASVRAAALASVGQRQDASARHALMRGLNDVDVAVRWQALAAMGQTRDPALRPVLEHVADTGDATWAAAAVQALGALGDRAATARLAALAQSPGPATKLTRAAIEGLGELGGADAAFALALRLQLQGTRDLALETTLTALRRLGSEAEPALLPLISPETAGPLLARLVDLIGEVGGRDCVPGLAALVGETNASVPAALTALSRLATRGVSVSAARAALSRAGRDPSQTVRRLAQAALNAQPQAQNQGARTN